MKKKTNHSKEFEHNTDPLKLGGNLDKEVDPVCICCGVVLKQEFHRDPTTIKSVDHQSFSDGMANRISAGYGSNLDGAIFIIGICDKCARKAIREHKIHVIDVSI